MNNGITVENGKLQIDMGYLASEMSKDEYKIFVKSLCMDDFVIDKVVDYICDEDEDGWWDGSSNEKREDILARVEDKQIGKSVKYNWSFLREVENKLRLIHSNKSMYYKVYHHKDMFHSLKSGLLDGEDCEYKTKKADEDIKAIYKIVEDAMKGLRDGK